ncbi:DUF397 domain-containing protein [Micromonospora sp. NPDC049679]|uniref:DUF397 domain-containing protein n=1 Tax=Micromonospora sp. NPDC049679 TaxID=3155920 RepID=UPI0033DD34F7
MRDRPGPWRRSSRCDTQACVEVRPDGDHVDIRDSAQPDGPLLTVTADAWRHFQSAVKRGGPPA